MSGTKGRIYMLKKMVIFMLGFVLLLPINAVSIERSEQIKVFEKKIREVLRSGILPIIDVEYHHGGKIEIEPLLKRMDENGVALTWLGTHEKLGSEESLRLNAIYPDRFVPTTVHGDGKLWHSSDKGFLEKLAKDVRSGKYFAMGEFEARHYPSSTNDRDVHMPVDSEAMQVVFQLSSETGVSFLLHHEAEDELLPELERMLAKYPKAKVVWCHVGRNRNPATWKTFRKADAVREFLKKYPNLYFDLVHCPAKTGSKHREKEYLEFIMYDVSSLGVSLGTEWKKVFEEFPEHFIIGSDINAGRFDNYDRVMETFRTIVLQGVRKDVAEKIAFKNAWKLMSGEDWRD
jgi:predicted TIM-barrel fold metal-dependent hydrolase